MNGAIVYEERGYNRFTLKFMIFFKGRGSGFAGKPPDPQEVNTTQCIDISRGGMRFESSEKIPPDSLLDIVITFDQKILPIELTGKVVWEKRLGNGGKKQLGIEFIGQTDQQKKSLEEDIVTYEKDMGWEIQV